MKEHLLALIRNAARVTRIGRLKGAAAAIRSALRRRDAAPAAANDAPIAVPPAIAPARPTELEHAAPAMATSAARDETPVVDLAAEILADVPRIEPGTFTSSAHTHAHQTRRYKLYAPPDATGRQLPLVVMLHGCTQDPDDFAAGTGMNERAREQGFFVLYPEQSKEANALRCWNWFKHDHQQRGSGEPALIAGMVQEVVALHAIDPGRVYIAGLSAGAAMAAIVAAAYPEIFAAVGIHSGLPGGAASSAPEAMLVMNGGAGHAGWLRPGATAPPPMTVPAIVFHGDEDRTVHPRNGEQVIMRMLDDAAPESNPVGTGARIEPGVSAGGRQYTRSIYPGDQGQALAEHWLVHGAGHAWSGGHAAGSYTDATGPDATREMLRFFFEHPLRA